MRGENVLLQGQPSVLTSLADDPRQDKESKITFYSLMITTKAVIKISVVRTEITINILSTTADNHYSYCRQQEPMVGAEGGG